MSDTPRTDEVEHVSRMAPRHINDAIRSEFARELERENVALRADKERLDWLASSPDKRLSTVHSLWVNNGDVADMRAAIDRARKEQP